MLLTRPSSLVEQVPSALASVVAKRSRILLAGAKVLKFARIGFSVCLVNLCVSASILSSEAWYSG